MSNDIAELIVQKVQALEKQDNDAMRVQLSLTHFYMDQKLACNCYHIHPPRNNRASMLEFKGKLFKLDSFNQDMISNVITQCILTEFIENTMQHHDRMVFTSDFDWISISITSGDQEIGKGAFYFTRDVPLQEIQNIGSVYDQASTLGRLYTTVHTYMRFALHVFPSLPGFTYSDSETV